jgi:hypothetical protein
MRLSELGFVWTERDNRSWNRAHESAGRKHDERVEAVAEQSGSKTARHGEAATQGGLECADLFPIQTGGDVFNSRAQQPVASRRIQMFAGPCERSQPRKSAGAN